MSRPTTLPSPWRELAKHAGGVEALAEALHVDRRTIGKWAASERAPRKLAREAVNEWARRRGLVEPWPARTVASPPRAPRTSPSMDRRPAQTCGSRAREARRVR